MVPHLGYRVFYRSCTILQSHQQCKRVPIFLFVCLFSLLMAMKWCLTVVLVCIFLLITDIKYLFMWLLAICISSLNKWVLKFFIFKKKKKERDTCTPMFIAALFTIARTWEQPRCPLADEWIRKLWYIYTIEYYSAIKKWIWISFNEVDETGAYYTEWSKSERKTPI